MSSNSIKPFIFLAFANEQDNRAHYLRNLPEEARRLRQVLDQATRDSLCEVIECPNATLEEILDVFQDARYRNRIAIFHYGGHANCYQLLLESTTGATTAADAGGLTAFLGQQTGLQLVFLNGCSTQPQVEELLAANVPAVIATSQAVDDTVVTDFAGRFYHGLAQGANLRTAFNEAVAAIKAARGSREMRALYYGQTEPVGDRWPWELSVKPGAEAVTEWNLPEAAEDPLFGLPPLPSLYLPEIPFLNLQYFTRQHAPVFFGRGYQIRLLYEQVLRGTDPIILLYGQSGVGKSSLLDAGVRPRLEANYLIGYKRRDREQGILAGLRQVLQNQTSVLFAEHSAEDFPVTDTWRAVEQAAGRPLVVILDQVEEIYTRPNPARPNELSELLATLRPLWTDPNCAPAGKLILSFRKEWLAEIEKQLSNHHLPSTKVFLERLDRRGIIEAVEGVTCTEALQQKYGLIVEPRLADIIADDLLADPGSPVAPTLQILLTKLWTQAKARNNSQPRFDQALYETLRRKGILLDDFLSQQLEALKQWRGEVVISGLALDLLTYHTTPQGTSEERLETDLLDIYCHQVETLPPLVQQCRDLFLLIEPAPDQPNQPKASRLAHDALAPLVRERFTASGLPGQRARRILENRVAEGKDNRTNLPLDDQDLALVEQGQAGMRVWTETETQLVQASRKERAKRKRDRAIRWVFSVFAVLLLAVAALVAEQRRHDADAARSAANVSEAKAISAAATAESRRQEAEQQANLALARQLTAQAELERNRKVSLLETSTLLAVESMKRFPTFEGDQVIRHDLALFPRMIAEIRHDGDMYEATFSPDGKWLATVGEDNIVRIWEAATKQEKMSIKHQGTLHGVVFSSDSKWLATASEDRTARVWEVTSGHELARMEHQGPVDGVIFSSDNKWLVTRSNQTVLVWNPINGREIAQMNHQDSVWAIVFSPNGRWLATASGDNTVLMWQVNNWQKSIRIPNEEAISFVTFSPDSKWLITSDKWRSFFGGRGGQFVWVWETATGQKVSQLEHNGLVSVAISSDGKWIATAGKDKIARLWELATGREITKVAHEHIVWDVGISPDNKWIATGSEDHTARIWELATGREIARMPHEHEVGEIAFSPDSQWVATASGEMGLNGLQQVQIWAAATGKEETRISTGVYGMVFSPDSKLLLTWDWFGAQVWEAIARDEVTRVEHEGDVNNLIFSPDGRWLAASSSGDNLVRIVEVGTWTERMQLKHTNLLNTSIVFSPDGNLLATIEDQTVWVWTTVTGQKVAQLFHQTPVYAIALSPNSRWLATGSKDGIVRIWEVETWRKVAELESDGPVNDVAFSPNSNWVAAGGWGKTIRVWEVNSWQAIIKAEKEQREVTRIIFSPNSAMMAAGRPGHSVQVWNLPAGTQIAQLEHENDVHCMAFSPNSRWLVTCNGWLARIWDIKTGKEVSRLSSNDLGAVDTVAFSPDSRWLAMNDRQAVRIWEVVSGQEMARVSNERIGEIRVVAFSPDGKWLAAGGGNHFPNSLGELRVWLWQPQDLIVEACSRLTRNLTYSEWREYIGDEEYHPTCPNLSIHESVIVAKVEELANQAETFIQANNSQAAYSAYNQATQLVIKTNDVLANDRICWKGSLNGFADIVLPTCEHAVDLLPDIEGYRFSRGLARALTGNYKGAAEDFEFYVARLKEQDPGKNISEQKFWISELELGRNPFDETILKALLQEKKQ